MEEVRADPIQLARQAQSALAGSQALFALLRTARAETVLTLEAIGDLAAAGPVAAAHTAQAEAAGMVLERLCLVLEYETEALYQTAFAYQEADQAAAGRLTGPPAGTPP